MKKSLIAKASSKPNLKTQEMQTVAIIVISVAVIVLACTVAVLLAQVDGHRKSIDAIEQSLSTNK